MKRSIYLLLAVLASFLTLGAADAPQAQPSKPKEVELPEVTALKLENLSLKMEQARALYEQLSTQRESIRVVACKEAKITEDRCAVDLQRKVITEQPPPEKK